MVLIVMMERIERQGVAARGLPAADITRGEPFDGVAGVAEGAFERVFANTLIAG